MCRLVDRWSRGDYLAVFRRKPPSPTEIRRHEAHLPAEQHQAEAFPRLSRPHVHPRGSQGPGPSTGQGPQAPGRDHPQEVARSAWPLRPAPPIWESDFPSRFASGARPTTVGSRGVGPGFARGICWCSTSGVAGPAAASGSPSAARLATRWSGTGSSDGSASPSGTVGGGSTGAGTWSSSLRPGRLMPVLTPWIGMWPRPCGGSGPGGGDEVGAGWNHPHLPAVHLAAVPAFVPVSPDLLQLRHRGASGPRPPAGLLDGAPPDRAVSSLPPRGPRPRPSCPAAQR